MDLRRSADGKWLVFHDSTLRRITGVRGSLSRSRWERLRALDAGRGERIPLVSEALALCRRSQVKVFLDIKVSGREDELLSILRRSGWLHAVLIGAGNRSSLIRWRRLLPRHPIFRVTGFRAPVTAHRVMEAARLKLTGLAVFKRWAAPAAIRRAHRGGLRLFVWTVRDPYELKRFARRGVDGIMSEVWPHPSI
jgi:glycerophosphoryl diester phosphodiesterase